MVIREFAYDIANLGYEIRCTTLDAVQDVPQLLEFRKRRFFFSQTKIHARYSSRNYLILRTINRIESRGGVRETARFFLSVFAETREIVDYVCEPRPKN